MKSARTAALRPRNGARDAGDLRWAFRQELRHNLQLAGRRPRSSTVHAVRKGITKLRSWLRLVREEIGGRRYRTHNRRLRQAARALAPIRDARVILAAFEKITSASVFPNAHQHLRKQARRAKKAAPAMMRKVERKLAKEVAAGERLPPGKITAADFSFALERMRAEMNAAGAAARAARSVELLHTWRKRTKNYLHALAFLAGEKNRRHQSAARINHRLGEDHDLTLLAAELASRRQEPENRALLNLIAVRRAKLQRRLFPG